jgi:hypothetical protein
VGGLRTIVVAWVHKKNLPSKRLLVRSGFAFRQALPPSFEEWVLEVLVEETAAAQMALIN